MSIDWDNVSVRHLNDGNDDPHTNPLLDKESLEHLYWTEKMSQKEIAARLGVSRPTVRKYMKMCGVNARTVSEAMKVSFGKGRHYVLDVNLDLNPNMFYLLGALKGDGSVGSYGGRYCITFYNTSDRLLELVSYAMKNIGLNPCPTFTEGRVPSLRAHSKKLLDFYKSIDYAKLGKHIETSGDGRDSALSFIRGMYESEGHYREREHSVEVTFYNTDVGLIDFCCKLLHYLGFKYSCRPSKKLKSGKIGYTVRILGGAKEVFRFLDDVNPCIKRGDDD